MTTKIIDIRYKQNRWCHQHNVSKIRDVVIQTVICSINSAELSTVHLLLLNGGSSLANYLAS